jgi:hypothetical protein
MAEALAFGAPRTEEITEMAIGMGSGLATGLVEGFMVSMAPKLGAAAPLITWGTLVGVPIIGAAGALFTRGMIGDLFKGVAAGGSAILGYSIPALVAPLTERRVGGGGGGPGVKQLGQGQQGSAILQQQGALKSVLEI